MTFLLLTLVTLLALTVFTITNMYKYKRGWILLLLIFLYAVWTTANFLYPRLEDYESALFFSRLIFSSTPLLVWTVLLLTFHYPVTLKYRTFGYLILTVVGFLAVIEAYIGQFTEGIILYLEYSPELGHYIFQFNSPLFLHYVLFISLVLALSVFFLYLKYRESKGKLRLQLRYLFWGFLVGFVTMGVTNMLFPMAFGIFQYSDIGPFFASTMLVTITYSSMIDRLHDLRYIFHNLLIWGLKVFIIFFILLAFFSLSIRVLYGHFPQLFDEIILIILVISLFITYFTHRFSVNEILLGGKKGEMFSDLEGKIAVELRLEKLGVLLMQYIKSALEVTDVLILVFDKQNRNVIHKTGKNGFKSSKILDTRDLLEVVEFWQAISEEPILSKEDLKALQPKFEGKMVKRVNRIIHSMEKDGIEMIVPLNRKVLLNGIIIIGTKEDTLPFTVQDYRLLEKIIRIASVAFGRAILYQEVNEFNRNLKGKVDEQTKELRSRMESMEQMRQRERDLLDIMGHELRTPLTIAKNSLELIDIYKRNQKKKRKHIKWDSNFEKQFGYIKASIRREMGIVETLLSATKLDAKKMDTHITEVDLVKIVETALLGFKDEAVRKGLKVKVEMNKKKSWVVKADSLQAQQILDNLFSNAVKYTRKGFVRIALKDEEKNISVVISDSGEGMHRDDIKKLGKKFFRLNQYAPTSNENGESEKGLIRPGGTGLGLYVSLGLIKLVGASYDIQSEVGKGTVFTVTFDKP